jgi:hypothetical protein
MTIAANWVSTQRQEFKNMNKGRTSQLNEHRIGLLNELDFAWEVPRGGRRRQLISTTEAATADSGKDSPADTNNILPGKALEGGGDGVPIDIEPKRKGPPVTKRKAKSKHPKPELTQQQQQQQEQPNEAAGFQVHNGWHRSVMTEAQPGLFAPQGVNPAVAAAQWSATMRGLPQQESFSRYQQLFIPGAYYPARVNMHLLAQYAGMRPMGGIAQNTMASIRFPGHGGMVRPPFGPGLAQQLHNSLSSWPSRLDPPADHLVNERQVTRNPRQTNSETLDHSGVAETEEKPAKRMRSDPPEEPPRFGVNAAARSRDMKHSADKVPEE